VRIAPRVGYVGELRRYESEVIESKKRRRCGLLGNDPVGGSLDLATVVDRDVVLRVATVEAARDRR
jgi:hypothetical protein